MDIAHQFKDTRKLGFQRNLIAAALGASLVLNAGLLVYNASRATDVILQPVIQSPLSISSAGVSRDYLELITRDTAYAVLNRTPQSLDYWMNAVAQDHRSGFLRHGQGADAARGGPITRIGHHANDRSEHDRRARKGAAQLGDRRTPRFRGPEGGLADACPLLLRLVVPRAFAETEGLRDDRRPEQARHRHAARSLRRTVGGK